MKPEEVYVVYHDGERLEEYGIKGAYNTEAAAKAIITTKAKSDAQHNYEWGKDWEDMQARKYWYELTGKERLELITKEKGRYNIVTYVPKITE